MVRLMTLVVLLSFFTTSSTEACAQMGKCLLLQLIDIFCLYIVHEYYPESYNISVLLSTSDSICRVTNKCELTFCHSTRSEQ